MAFPDNLTNWTPTTPLGTPPHSAVLNALEKITVGPAVYNVKGYGATGDGSTNDTTAIQAAIEAANTAGGGRVVFPKGTYIFTLITLRSDVWLEGVGRSSVLKFRNTTNTDNVIAGTSISHAGIRNLTVDYNHVNNASSQIGMRIATSSYVTVEGCTFLNCRGFAVSFAGDNALRNNHITVVGNNVLNPISSPNDMFLVVSDYGLVARNRIVGPNANLALVLYESDHLMAWGNEVELTSGAGHTGIGILSCRYANVFGNKVAGAGNGLGIGLYTEHDNPSPVASERNSVYGNTISNVATGIQLLETNYDRVVSNRVEQTTNAIEFPVSARPQAGNLLLADNDLRYNNTTTINNSGGASTNLWFQRNATSGSAIPSVASAATIAVPAGEEVVQITGTTNIDTITATTHAGRRITLVFSGALTANDGTGNLRLSANFTTTADDTLTLACDGTNWFEIARSTN